MSALGPAREEPTWLRLTVFLGVAALLVAEFGSFFGMQLQQHSALSLVSRRSKPFFKKLDIPFAKEVLHVRSPGTTSRKNDGSPAAGTVK